MNGIFVAVVGPSGVGKDSIIRYAAARLNTEAFVFARRVVTRTSDGSEDHDSLDVDAFEKAKADGAFMLSWSAHGLRYGLRASLERDLQRGRIVIANLSRSVLPDLMQRLPTAIVVAVTAQADVIAERLATRNRSSDGPLSMRMSRQFGDWLPASTIRLDNSGPLAVAGDQFVGLLEELAVAHRIRA